jgi:NAD(P)-dependent dehydrogenase (short-subunit alcohol dehydrogenase family)
MRTRYRRCSNRSWYLCRSDGLLAGMDEMTGRVALVTGANRGIGLAVAQGLAASGATVLVAARAIEAGERAAAGIRATGGAARAVQLDVTDPASIQAAARTVDGAYGRLDVLVNNAGIPGDVATQVPGAVDLATVAAVLATNVCGVIAVTEALLPALRRAGAARIVNVSSSVGSLARMSDPNHYFARLPAALAYAPSKAALNQVTVQYAKALRDAPILVNAADPGACATDFVLGVPTDRHPGVTRSAADGAAIVLRLAALPPDGPSGGLFADAGPVPW